MVKDSKPTPFLTPAKTYSGKDFSYASPHDSWLKQKIIRTIENLTGRKTLQDMYDQLMASDPNPWDVWSQGLRILNISWEYAEEQLAKIPKEGPIIFVANHPFGVVDGAIFCHLITRVRKDYFLLVNEVLSHVPFLQGHLLPVDFRQNEQAQATNLATKQHTTDRLREGDVLAIFPSGAVATAMKFFGPVEELPWRRFICTRIHETQCTVVPFFFHGRNSRLFQLVSKFSMNLRLGLLLHEVMNKRGETVQVEIGDPIRYDEMAPYEDRQELIDFLKQRTMALGNGQGRLAPLTVSS